MTDPFRIQRIIIECLPEHLDFACRASKWLLERPTQKDAILAYGDGDRVAFYIKRNKSSISVRQDHNPLPAHPQRNEVKPCK